jgi:hypothetical protein
VDWTNGNNSTFTKAASISVSPFSQACGGGTCIPQPDTTQQLDSLGDRLMFRVAYRNFGDHESLVTNHSVTANGGVGVRWYEIRNPSGSPVLYQQGTFAPDSQYRWMGSIAMDHSGDIALGYSLSSSSTHPSIRYTGRMPTDPPGTMEEEREIVAGTGSQTNGLNRWGDYSSMSIDPIDDCTFYYTNQYIPSDGSFNWNTQIASFRFPDCGSATPPSNPSAPSLTLLNALNTYQIQLNWTEPSGQKQTGFNIYRCQGSSCAPSTKVASVNGDTFAYTDGSSSNPLNQSTTYTYQVTAVNSSGESAPSSPAYATTKTESAPTNLTSSAVLVSKSASVTLRWNNPSSTDADSNRIERCKGSSCTNFSQIATVGGNTTVYNDNNVARRTTYKYRVRAHSPGGYSAYSNVTTVITP